MLHNVHKAIYKIRNSGHGFADEAKLKAPWEAF
jgi:hypothetical protein